SGRGELHLSVLIENMRREGFEFAVSKAEVLYKTDENGKKTEPADPGKCIGCFECITVCGPKAITAEWETELYAFVERIAEYAYGAVQNKKEKVIYINFVLNVTPDCDCVAWSDAPLIADIGILASTDPVAIDKASYDLVTKAQSLIPMENNGIGIDKFTRQWGYTHGYHQIEHAAEIGLGSLDYELINI
ncbi:MAG TPA: 4Fe-4S ferredoxin, partial [Desulfovibrio sp.]|nr:4Fe-4S ferredoxin [Desulfovibrio sp.]